MTKTEKKAEQLLIKQLTNACEELKLHTDSFKYLTHHGKMNKAKNTLKVELFCVNLLTSQQLRHALAIINKEIHSQKIILKPHDLIMTLIDAKTPV
jgi:hypothetical protein